jgi:hypothetical protein
MSNVTIDVTGGGQHTYGFSGHGVIKNCTISAVNSGVGIAVAMFDNSDTHTTITGSKLSGDSDPIGLGGCRGFRARWAGLGAWH